MPWSSCSQVRLDDRHLRDGIRRELLDRLGYTHSDTEAAPQVSSSVEQVKGASNASPLARLTARFRLPRRFHDRSAGAPFTRVSK